MKESMLLFVIHMSEFNHFDVGIQQGKIDIERLLQRITVDLKLLFVYLM